MDCTVTFFNNIKMLKVTPPISALLIIFCHKKREIFKDHCRYYGCRLTEKK